MEFWIGIRNGAIRLSLDNPRWTIRKQPGVTLKSSSTTRRSNGSSASDSLKD